MKVIYIFKIFLCLVLPATCFAYTEFERPVRNIWSSLNSIQNIRITFSDGGSAIYKTESQITPGQMSRFISLALTAQTTKKNIVVRYPEDGLIYPPTGVARNDAEGIWINEK